MSIQSEINRINTAVNNQESLIGEIATALAARCVITEPILQAKTVTPSEEVQTVTPDNGYHGLSSVTVEAAQGGEGTYGWKKSVSKLPSGYTEVEYLQSSGTQYIDLGISVPHATARVVVTFEPTSVGNKTHAVVGHANTSFGWTTNFIYYVADGRFGLNGGVASGVTAAVGTRYTFDYTSQGYSVNGGAFVSATRSFTDGYNDTIFYSSGTYGAFKLYAYQLYNGDELVRDCVPCTNPSGVAGLYDTINGVFYTNAGTGSFIAGNPIRYDLPSGYTQIEYIESSGTQYIDTGVVGKSGLESEFDFTFTTVPSNGGFLASTSAAGSTYLLYCTDGPRLGLGYYNSWLPSTYYPAAGVRYNIKSKLYAGEQKLEVNGTTVVSSTIATSVNSGFTLPLFALNSSGSVVNFSSAKLYFCKIYDNGTLVRDFVPCTNASGIAGLYDFVNGKFYANTGSGTFAVGSTTNPPSTIEVVGYVVSDDAYAYPDGEFLDGYYYEKL